jgi:hypothetical protein
MLRPIQELIRDSGGMGTGERPGCDGFFFKAACFCPDWLANGVQLRFGASFMIFVSQISFHGLLGSLFVCLALRQMMILVLPDRVAGPGGWFIDTGTEEKA